MMLLKRLWLVLGFLVLTPIRAGIVGLVGVAATFHRDGVDTWRVLKEPDSVTWRLRL